MADKQSGNELHRVQREVSAGKNVSTECAVCNERLLEGKMLGRIGENVSEKK